MTWPRAVASGAPHRGSGVRTLIEHLDATGRLGELARPLVASGDEGVRAHVIDMLGGPR